MKKSPKVELGNLSSDEVSTAPAKKNDKKTNTTGKNGNKKGAAGKNGNKKRGASIKKFFRDLVSELKKVSWGKMKDTKNNKGVLSQTGIVLLFVLVAIIILTCMDLGLTALLNLLIGIAK